MVTDKIRSKSCNFVANLPPKSNQRMCKLNIADRKRVAHAWDRWDGVFKLPFQEEGYGIWIKGRRFMGQQPTNHQQTTGEQQHKTLTYIYCVLSNETAIKLELPFEREKRISSFITFLCICRLPSTVLVVILLQNVATIHTRAVLVLGNSFCSVVGY